MPVRIYYEDTDAGGIVYHANYLRFCERARTEMLREAKCNNAEFVKETGLMFVVRHIDISYHLPSFLDDALEVRSHVNAIGGASFTLQQNIYRNDHLITETKVVLVCVDEQSKRPAKLPEKLRNALAPYYETQE